MRILFLSDNFPPEGNAPASRLYEHAIRWVEAGHQVTVITCAPNFPEGKVYDGYRNRWRQVENVDGIRVVRVKTFITANAGVVLRTLDYLSFMVSGFLHAIFESRPDVVIATSPQFFTSVAGWLTALRFRRPFVFEVRDLWPESIAAVGAFHRGLALQLIESIELFLYRRSRLIVVVSPAFKDNLSSRGIPAEKIRVVTNGFDPRRYSPRPRNADLALELGLSQKFVVGYIGTHGMAHALEHVLHAAQQLQSETQIHFLFVGTGAAREQVVALANQLKLRNCTFVPRQPKESIAEYWSLLDLALVPLRNTETFRSVLPSKIFESMAMGTPVLTSIPDGTATRLVAELGIGELVEPENPQQMAERIRLIQSTPRLLQSLRTAAQAARATWSRDALAADYLSELSPITTR